MHARMMVASLLLFSSAAGMAAPQTWEFSYTGFYNQLTGRFEPGHVLAGAFTGEDRNDDGVIDAGELSSMLIYGDRDYKTCGGTESPYYACGVGPFYFGPGNDLSFSLGEESHDRLRQEGGGHTVDTGDRDWSYRIVNGVEQPYRFYRWTGTTALQVSLVPEPGERTLLAAGAGLLLGLGVLRRHTHTHTRTRGPGRLRGRQHA